MSGVDATAYVMRLKLRTPAHKLALLALATRCDQAYSCFPSRALVAGEALVSEERAKTILRDLRRDGFLSARQRYRDNGSKTSNRYYLHGPWDHWGGTRTPFEEIAHYGRADDRYAAIREGDFIPRPARPDPENGAGGADDPSPQRPLGGVAGNPSQGTPALPRQGIAHNPSLTDHHEPTKGTATDVRRTAGGLLAPLRAASGRAAEPHSGASRAAEGAGKKKARRRTVSTRPRRRPPGFETVAQALPPQAQPTHPGAPLAPTLVRAICDALTGVPADQPGTYRIPPRTPEQLIARINRRWYRADGPERAAPNYAGPDRIRRPVGYIATLLTTQECPNPSCEDGIIIGTGATCRACTQRRTEEQQARRATEKAAETLGRQQRSLEEQQAAVHTRDTAAARQEQTVRRHLASAGLWGELLEYKVAEHMAQWHTIAAG
ncbi:hypothetical protein [Streptomyces xinghaiensis]|uniref:hypothetical protein n=1 Tax=Streptomyces xinghaiensis TaxID=1038928 RepID=UPI0002D59FBD|nr:hypothetical protein [Streptomyces xinghaiensis]MZE76744.1 hypothetical protein [Streptomyces sp. SID5475]